MTPLKIPDLRRQTYRVKLEMDGYEVIEDRAVLSKDKSFIYELKPQSGE